MNMYFGIQRALSANWMLESAFVGTRGVKFPMKRVFNPVDRLTGLRPNPNLGEGYYVDNTKAFPPRAEISAAITRATQISGLRTSSIREPIADPRRVM